jgi:hypothetical protein
MEKSNAVGGELSLKELPSFLSAECPFVVLVIDKHKFWPLLPQPGNNLEAFTWMRF